MIGLRGNRKQRTLCFSIVLCVVLITFSSNFSSRRRLAVFSAKKSSSVVKANRNAMITTNNFQHPENMIKFDPNSIPPAEDLEKLLLPILEKGLILVGDSTSRFLFGFVWCVMEGFFSDGIEAGKQKCWPRQKVLKEKMSTVGSYNVVNFSKYPNATMAYFPENKLQAVRPEKVHAMLPSAQFIFFRMSCLHELWNPGWRETYATNLPSQFPRLFEEWYESINHLKGTTEHGDERVVMVASSVAMCDAKTGPAGKLIDAWLNDEPLNGQKNEDSKTMIKYYNNDLPKHKQLPLDYTGLIPPIKAIRRDLRHEFDDNMFNDNGVRFCSRVGQEVFGKMKFTNIKPPFLLDSRSAYENQCENTGDGRHYNVITMMREVSLILKAYDESLN